MRAAIHNRFPGRDPRRWTLAAVFTGCVAILLGLVALPAVSWSHQRQVLGGLRERLHAAPAPQSFGFDPTTRAQALDELTRTVRSWVPAEIVPLEVFGTLRLAARANDVRLHLVQPGREEVVDPEFGEEAVVGRKVTVSGKAGLSRLAPFVSDVRAAGYPLEVRALTAARTDTGSDQFQFQLELRFFQRVPRPADTVAGADSPEVLE